MRFLNSLLLIAALILAASCSQKFRTYNGPAVTSVIVYKSQRRMILLHDNTILKDYQIALGGNPVGPKQFEGDGKTPEGVYFINRRNPNSHYYLSLGISYPNDQDRLAATAAGKPPGGDIFIHGRDGRNRGRGADWTVGCVAVKDKEMAEIYSMVGVGTPIFLKP